MNNARIVGRIVFHSNVRLRSIFTVLSIIMMATTARPEQVTLWTMADGMDGGGGGITMLNGDHRNGENGESADPFYTSPPPCHKWDPYLKEAVPSYDPTTQGCCVDPETGEEVITDNPEEADPCDHVTDVVDEIIANKLQF